MNIFGEYINEAYEDKVILESVESNIKKSGGNIDRLLSKFKLSKNDVDDAKSFISKNGLMSKLKQCKSIKDIRIFMKSKEYKEALEKEKNK